MAKTIDKTDEEVNRLHDMLVHEVSLVDRAANNRTFLLLKRSEQMNVGAEVVENEAGDLTAVEDTSAPVVKVESEYAIAAGMKEQVQASTTEALKRLTDTATAIKALPDAPEGTGIPGELALELAEVMKLLVVDDSTEKSEEGEVAFIDNVTKASALRMLAESMERLVAVVKAVQEAKAPEGEDVEKSLPEELTKELSDIACLVGGVIERHAKEAAAEPEVEKTSEETRREETLKTFAREDSADTDPRIAALAKAAGAITVKKAGAKMSASRLDKLQTVARELLAILQDVAPDAFDEIIGKATDVPAPAADTPPAPVAKAEPVEDPRVAELTAKVAGLEAANKKQAAELSRLNKSFNLPNSVVVESTPSEAPVVQEAPVGWPSDMNSPISKATVKKGHWFGSK